MNKFAIKLSMLLLAGTISSSFIIPSVNVSAIPSNNLGFEMSNIENKFSKYQDFIHIANGKYVIDDSLINNKDKDVEALKTQIDFINSIIDKYNVQDTSLEEGFTIYVSNAEINKSLIEQGYDLSEFTQANYSYAQRGCVVSWNYLLGLQDIWAQ